MQTPGFLDYVPRVGYLAKGVVYGLVGVLAAMVAVGAGGQVSGSKGALQVVQKAPFGDWLLFALCGGLFAYAAWRLSQGLFNPESERLDGVKGVVTRIQSVVSGVVHVGLAAYTGRIAMGWNSDGGSWSAKLMGMEYGPYAIGAFGIIVGGLGLTQFYKAYTTDFLDNLKTEKMSDAAKGFVSKVGRIGLTARGIVFLLIGWILVEAAIISSAWEAEQAGLGKALNTIAAQPYGAPMLAAVATGVACYGLFSILKGYYRRLKF